MTEQNLFHDAESIESLMAQAVGAGSMCWEPPITSGGFDSTHALRVVDHAIERLKQLTEA